MQASLLVQLGLLILAPRSGRVWPAPLTSLGRRRLGGWGYSREYPVEQWMGDVKRAYSEELFGPVAVVSKVGSDEEALALANDTLYGLGGSVFSKDPARASTLAQKLEVGMANVNTTAGEGAEIPFGGVIRSGFGRELGPLGMDEFVNKRMYYIADKPSG